MPGVGVAEDTAFPGLSLPFGGFLCENMAHLGALELYLSGASQAKALFSTAVGFHFGHGR